MGVHAFLFIVLSRRKNGMICTFISFFPFISLSQVTSKPNQTFPERTKTFESFPETRSEAWEKMGSDFQLELLIMKYYLRNINKKCQNNVISQNEISTAKYFKVGDDILPLKCAFIDSLKMPMEQTLKYQMICHDTNSKN